MKEVRVFAPATVANVACGFDSLGFALTEPGDRVVARLCNRPGVHIATITGDGGRLPLDAAKNTAGVAVIDLLHKVHDTTTGIELHVHKHMPLGSGLGSSAASAVAAVVAANELLGAPLERVDLLPFVMHAEQVACGAAHADNVAPALLGGFVLVRSYQPLDVIKLDYPDDLWAAVLHPHIELLTSDARSVLRKTIRLDDAITQWSNLAGLIAGLITRNHDLIGRSLKDTLIEPVRSLLIPGFDAVKAAALERNALGCSISGSGPSIFALCRGEEQARDIGTAMRAAMDKFGLGSDLYHSPVNATGAVVEA
jgi:homoserine kinase